MVHLSFAGEILKHTESFEWKGTGMAHFRLARKDAWAMFC